MSSWSRVCEKQHVTRVICEGATTHVSEARRAQRAEGPSSLIEERPSELSRAQTESRMLGHISEEERRNYTAGGHSQ